MFSKTKEVDIFSIAKEVDHIVYFSTAVNLSFNVSEFLSCNMDVF